MFGNLSTWKSKYVNVRIDYKYDKILKNVRCFSFVYSNELRRNSFFFQDIIRSVNIMLSVFKCSRLSYLIKFKYIGALNLIVLKKKHCMCYID